MKTIQNHLGTFNVFNQDYVCCHLLENGRVPSQDIIDIHLSPWLRGAKMLIHVGAENGITSYYTAKKHSSLNVYAFEPRDRYFCMLMKTMALNACENIMALNNVLGHMSGPIKVPGEMTCPISCDYNDILDLGQGNVVANNNEFCFVTLDSLQLLACDVIYVDFPGMEYLVLLGGLRTIQKFKPTICFHTVEDVWKREFYDKLGIEGNIHDMLHRLEYTVTEVEPDVYLAVSLQREQVQGLVNVGENVVTDTTEVTVA